ncbi:TPA: hypothetical protein EYP38_03950, partial [Candidatus Micrarchaeota archaeon]|nr:hypothetical protein [Candidatus Micrarchaeota archaeon]
AFIQGNPDLRDPQVEGWFRTRQHFRNSSEHAILQIPVGCGKTGLMALLPFEIAQGRVLVIAPNLEIRRGISTAFDVAGRECFWTSTRVLTDVSHGPFTAVLDGQDATSTTARTRISWSPTSSSWPAGRIGGSRHSPRGSST